jgi:hypothetical protein
MTAVTDEYMKVVKLWYETEYAWIMINSTRQEDAILDLQIKREKLILGFLNALIEAAGNR